MSRRERKEATATTAISMLKKEKFLSAHTKRNGRTSRRRSTKKNKQKKRN